MNVAAIHEPQWSVTTRRDGEILAVWSGADDLQLGLAATPGSFSVAEYQGWLTDLLSVARETARADATDRPIPALLHQALTGLLFSHGELWERAGGPHCSMALVQCFGEVAFGWVGEADVEVQIDGRPVDVEWVSVRDAEGREARAISLDASRWVRIGLVWRPRPDATSAMLLDAEWRGAFAPAAGPEAGTEPVIERAAELEFVELPSAPETEMAEADSADPLRSAIEAALAEREAGAKSSAEALPAPSDEDAAREREYARAIEAGHVPEYDLPVPKPGRLTRMWSRFNSLWRRPAARAAEPEIEPELEPMATQGPPMLLTADALLPAPEIADPQMPTFETAEVETIEALPEQNVELFTSSPERPSLTPPIAYEPEAHVVEIPALPVAEAPEAPTEEPAESYESAAAAEVLEPAGPETESDIDIVHGSKFEAAHAIGHEITAAADADRDPADDAVWIEPDSAWNKSAAGARTPLRPHWPSAAELSSPAPLMKRPWVWGVVLLVLFVGGYYVGTIQNDPGAKHAPNPFVHLLRMAGLGGARFTAQLESRPEGAWVSVDGKDLAVRTPTNIELKPGVHQVALSFTDLGSASFTVRGMQGDQQQLDESLWGSLSIEQMDPGIPVSVAVDGNALGYVPARVDSIAPGDHEIRFSGPGMTPWAQTVEVRVRESAQVVAHPMTSPATGVLVVRAVMNDEQGSTPLDGADVWIDGELTGRTPLTMELPRGPHSVRVASHGQSAPVQVIDLPGGNQRFGNFELGLGSDRPRLTPVSAPEHILSDHASIVSAALDGMNAGDISEMWLHVHGGDGAWRRYPLDVMKTPTGVVGVVVFPGGVFDAQGRTHYYMSALSRTGDEFFTEMANAQWGTGPAAAPALPPAIAPPPAAKRGR
jgi:PEGA domain